ncbi:MAG TPA: aldose 1-epimerase family protein [Steroidobacteraceae bacterium]|nr:aldose 1-epimerase family protein [Steroidobacteraceae bacterium]
MTLQATAAVAVGNPSGEQIELRHSGQRAIVVEISGGLRTYEVNGHALLDGYGADEMCTGARGQILVPWPNRLRDGRYDFKGTTYQVPLTEPAKRNAIHGFLRWESWTLADRGDDWVVLEHALRPREGYPFFLRLGAEYRLSETGLTATFTATNCGDRPCPYGIGAHPYLRVDAETINDCWLEAPGGRHLLEDDQAIPVGVADVDGSEYDFRAPRQIRQTELDTTFVVSMRGADGRAWVRLWPDGEGPGVGLWMDQAYPYYMLFTGDSLPDASQRRRAVGVEPMTCAPNAFASGDGLIVLAPGEAITSSWGIAPLAQR